MHQNNRMQSLTLCIVDSLTCSAADTPVVVANCKQAICVINKILISQLVACQRQLSGYYHRELHCWCELFCTGK